MLYLIVQEFLNENDDAGAKDGTVNHVMLYGHNGNKDNLIALGMFADSSKAMEVARNIQSAIQSSNYSQGKQVSIKVG